MRVALSQYKVNASHTRAALIIVIVCVQHGIGVEKDEADAVRWYRLGADQGYALSQNSLGYCYRVHEPRCCCCCVCVSAR